MATPKNLKQALENGYVISKLYGDEKKLRVTLEERHHRSGCEMFLEFWIDREYFKRNYPGAYERLL